jgi:methionyl-tRNA formyltransferase
MTNTSKTLVFFGNERLLTGLASTDAPILSGLIDQGYNVAAVVAHYNESKSRDKRPLEVAAIAEEHDIPVLLPDGPADIYDQLAAFHADAAVLVAYGRIVPQNIIDLFPLGIINIHPSLLPKYRGSTPIESAILNGDTTTGVSIMSLSAKMDAGPVYDLVEIPLSSA